MTAVPEAPDRPAVAGPVSWAVVGVRVGPGRETVVDDLRSSGALALRPGAGSVWMVGAAASPIGGDRQHVRVRVGAGARLVVGSVSATVARRGPPAGGGGAPSVTAVVARVAPGATLVWEPEPGVAAEGADHISDTRVRLADGAGLWWREEWVLGRHGEGPGRWRSRFRLLAGRLPALVTDAATGPGAPGWQSRSGFAAARAFSSVVAAGPACSPGTGPADGGGPVAPAGDGAPAGLVVPGGGGAAAGTAFPVAGPVPGWQVSSWGEDLACCRDTVAALLDRLGLIRP